MLTSPCEPTLVHGEGRLSRKRSTRAFARNRKVSLAQVHDRQATNLPDNAQVRVVTVDDPYEPGAKITALASLRGDPLGRLHERDQLRSPQERIDDAKRGRNTGTARYEAGRWYQKRLELAEVGSVKAMDTTKEPVDGGGMTAEPITERQRRACKELDLADKKLGIHGKLIARAILGDRCSLKQVAVRFGLNTGERAVSYLGARFREILETLAKVSGNA